MDNLVVTIGVGLAAGLFTWATAYSIGWRKGYNEALYLVNVCHPGLLQQSITLTPDPAEGSQDGSQVEG